jgi:hypothetical protein
MYQSIDENLLSQVLDQPAVFLAAKRVADDDLRGVQFAGEFVNAKKSGNLCTVRD